jgi:hypothetical protein
LISPAPQCAVYATGDGVLLNLLDRLHLHDLADGVRTITGIAPQRDSSRVSKQDAHKSWSFL